MKMLPSIFSIRRPWDCFTINLSYVEKTEKIQQMCEELKDGGTKAMKERTEKKGRNEICSKSQTLVSDSRWHTHMPKQT